MSDSVSLTAALQCIVISLKRHFGNGVGKEKVKPRNVIIIASFIQKEKEREREGKTLHKYGRIYVLLNCQKEEEKNSLAEGSGWI